MKLKKLVPLTLALALSFSLMACGSNDSEKQQEETTTEVTEEAAASGEIDTSILKGKTISYMTSQAKFKEEYNLMAEKFEEKYGAKVEFQVVPDNEFYSMVKVKLSTSEVPDVFEYNYPTQNSEIGAAQYTVDLSNQPWVERLTNPDFLKDPDDGKFYALPLEGNSSTQAVYYNKEVLASAGIENPQPKTYAEFLEILDAIKENTDATPFYMTNADTWTTQIFMTGGIPTLLGDNAKDTFDKLLKNEIKWSDIPEAQKVLSDYMELIEKGYVNDDYLTATYDTAAEQLGTGKSAMYLTIEQCAIDTKTKYPDVELGSFVIPFGDRDVVTMGAYVNGLFVPKEGAQVDVALAFLEAWSDPEVQNVFYESFPGFPPFTDVDGGEVLPAIQNLVDNYVNQGKYSIQLNDQMAIASPIWPDLWNMYVEAITGTKTPEEVFEAFQLQYEDFMSQQQQEGF